MIIEIEIYENWSPQETERSSVTPDALCCQIDQKCILQLRSGDDDDDALLSNLQIGHFPIDILLGQAFFTDEYYIS